MADITSQAPHIWTPLSGLSDWISAKITRARGLDEVRDLSDRHLRDIGIEPHMRDRLLAHHGSGPVAIDLTLTALIK